MAAVERDLCVLVAGVVGAARLNEKLGEAEAQRAVERCVNRIERAVASHKGRVMQSGGEEVLAAFDDAESGWHAAVEMQQKIDGLPPISSVRMALRVGFEFGRALEDSGRVIGAAANAAVRLAALAKPGQIVTSMSSAGRLSAQTLQRPLTMRGGETPACELVWHDHHGGAKPQPRLRLRHGGEELILGPGRTTATLGRDKACDITIRESRASRAHGRIELRGEGFVLVDTSSNGSYVGFQGEAEFQLKGSEAVLRGQGRISFGHAWAPDTKETVEFFVEE